MGPTSKSELAPKRMQRTQQRPRENLKSLIIDIYHYMPFLYLFSFFLSLKYRNPNVLSMPNI